MKSRKLIPSKKKIILCIFINRCLLASSGFRVYNLHIVLFAFTVFISHILWIFFLHLYLLVFIYYLHFQTKEKIFYIARFFVIVDTDINIILKFLKYNLK